MTTYAKFSGVCVIKVGGKPIKVSRGMPFLSVEAALKTSGAALTYPRKEIARTVMARVILIQVGGHYGVNAILGDPENYNVGGFYFEDDGGGAKLPALIDPL